MIGIIALWTGTVAGPDNPNFWRQIAPLAFIAVVLFLFIIRSTRTVIVGLAKWLFSLRVLTRKQRAELAKAKTAPRPRQSLPRVIIPGETRHGRLKATENRQTKVQRVTWSANGMYVGTLTPGKAGGWEVLYGSNDEALGWVGSKTAGMELLEKTDASDAPIIARGSSN